MDNTAFAVAVLVALLAVAWVVGQVLGRIETARSRRRNLDTWAPLASIVSQDVVPEIGRISGTYRGRSIDVRRGEAQPSDSGIGYNFEIELKDARGPSDWEIAYWPLLGVFGKPRGAIKASASVKAQLDAAGAIQLIDGIGVEKVTHVYYSRKRSVLAFNEDVRPGLVPTAPRFQQQLDLLMRLDAVNQQMANAAGEIQS